MGERVDHLDDGWRDAEAGELLQSADGVLNHVVEKGCHLLLPGTAVVPSGAPTSGAPAAASPPD
ncbi:hypothetical protein [Actinopolymorpha pittospori]